MSDLSSEIESDEKQLLVHQTSGTTVINVDHGLATYTAGAAESRPAALATASMPHIRYAPTPGSARGSVSSSIDSCSLTSHSGGMGRSVSGGFVASAVTAGGSCSSSGGLGSAAPPLGEEELRRIRFDKLVQKAKDIEISSFVSSTNNCM